jgi:hypothetical protein
MSSSSLGGGAIAGITIGAIGAIALLALAVAAFLFLKKRGGKVDSPHVEIVNPYKSEGKQHMMAEAADSEVAEAADSWVAEAADSGVYRTELPVGNLGPRPELP